MFCGISFGKMKFFVDFSDFMISNGIVNKFLKSLDGLGIFEFDFFKRKFISSLSNLLYIMSYSSTFVDK